MTLSPFRGSYHFAAAGLRPGGFFASLGGGELKDFFSHIDLITHAASELLQGLGDDLAAEDSELLFGSITFGQVRRLRKAIEDYHARYSEAESGVVQKLLALEDDDDA